MRPFPSSPTGTQFPALLLEGWIAGEEQPRSHAVPAPGARWTLVCLSPTSRAEVDEHRGRLAAEAVTAVVVAGAPRVCAAVLVDPAGTIQHVADSVEDALDAVAAFRMGTLAPRPARPRRCPAEGRRRRGARVAGRRPA